MSWENLTELFHKGRGDHSSAKFIAFKVWIQKAFYLACFSQTHVLLFLLNCNGHHRFTCSGFDTSVGTYTFTPSLTLSSILMLLLTHSSWFPTILPLWTKSRGVSLSSQVFPEQLCLQTSLQSRIEQIVCIWVIYSTTREQHKKT